MKDETLFQRATTYVRRLRLPGTCARGTPALAGGARECALGEAMPWHRDPFHRITVILGGDAIAIEYRNAGEAERFEVAPGQVDWDKPTDRVHRGMNVGKEPYEEITIFFLDHPDDVPQPREE